ncbi:O-methyltransferase [Obba rivulosa]|uniref:O-methyltransferase n=1 Tax=Obba rivulosa TaxID=1052685 RepID=A0A8E2DJ36_9APHY|nr:O-methyltransferase [Obba rivulosa]
MADADISALASIISTNVSAVLTKCAALGTPLPTLADPFPSSFDGVSAHMLEEIMTIVAAAQQLIATVQMPSQYTTGPGSQTHVNAALDAVMIGHVTEILREAGPSGLPVDEIAAKNNMDPGKLARLLRILATNHIFKEVSPDVFANNRISASLDTGKSFSEIVSNPNDKYTATSGSGAFTALICDTIKTAAYLPETLHDPQTASSQEVTETAFNRAYGTNTPYFEWLHKPENGARRRMFDAAMTGLGALGNPKEILEGFEWDKLPEGSIVVDVGGGVGTTMQVLFDEHKHLKYVVQDREPVMADARTFWETHRPEALKSNQVTLQAHDFFDEQPIKNARVFFLRAIMHNWPTHHAARILRRLRYAAAPDTQLVLADNIVPYACRERDGPNETDVLGAKPFQAPEGLLPNWGLADNFVYTMDSWMLLSYNAQERTIKGFKDLLGQAGWRLDRVYRSRGDKFPRLVASPV